jgi:hypothetical protein
MLALRCVALRCVALRCVVLAPCVHACGVRAGGRLQESAKAGKTLEITIWGDEPVVVDTELPSAELDEMQDEESGNQWLYSCVLCGDGGDVAMCDAVRIACMCLPHLPTVQPYSSCLRTRH